VSRRLTVSTSDLSGCGGVDRIRGADATAATKNLRQKRLRRGLPPAAPPRTSGTSKVNSGPELRSGRFLQRYGAGARPASSGGTSRHAGMLQAWRRHRRDALADPTAAPPRGRASQGARRQGLMHGQRNTAFVGSVARVRVDRCKRSSSRERCVCSILRRDHARSGCCPRARWVRRGGGVRPVRRVCPCGVFARCRSV